MGLVNRFFVGFFSAKVVTAKLRIKIEVYCTSDAGLSL